MALVSKELHWLPEVQCLLEGVITIMGVVSTQARVYSPN